MQQSPERKDTNVKRATERYGVRSSSASSIMRKKEEINTSQTLPVFTNVKLGKYDTSKLKFLTNIRI